MNNQFKPGDLALIKICVAAPEMVGKCVALETEIPPGGWHRADGLNWSNDNNETCWLVSGDGLQRAHRSGRIQSGVAISMFRQSCLMPLRGEFEPEQAKSVEVSV